MSLQAARHLLKMMARIVSQDVEATGDAAYLARDFPAQWEARDSVSVCNLALLVQVHQHRAQQ